MEILSDTTTRRSVPYFTVPDRPSTCINQVIAKKLRNISNIYIENENKGTNRVKINTLKLKPTTQKIKI